MITSKEISIVIQGAYFEGSEFDFDTRKVIESWRIAFPNSEIILSTWKNQKDLKDNDLSHLKIKSVFSEDPGSDEAGILSFNINRQIISTAAGVKLATRKYVIKSRSDVKIDSNLILRYYNLHLQFQPEGLVFREPIGIYSLSTRNWKKGFIPHLLHPCDWLYLGLAEDLRELFGGDPYSEEALQYFKDKKMPRRRSFSGTSRYVPEQFILVDYLFRKNILKKVDFSDYSVQTRMIRKLNYSIFKKDFIVLDEDQIGLKSKKYPNPHSRNIQISQLRHEEWSHYTGQKHMPFLQNKSLFIHFRLVTLRMLSIAGTLEYVISKFKYSMFQKIKRNQS